MYRAKVVKEDGALRATVTRGHLQAQGCGGGITIPEDYLKEVKPRFFLVRTYQRTSYRPGEIGRAHWGGAAPAGSADRPRTPRGPRSGDDIAVVRHLYQFFYPLPVPFWRPQAPGRDSGGPTLENRGSRQCSSSATPMVPPGTKKERQGTLALSSGLSDFCSALVLWSLLTSLRRTDVLRNRWSDPARRTWWPGIFGTPGDTRRIRTITLFLRLPHLSCDPLVAPDFAVFGRLIRIASPPMRFVFLGAGVCLGFPFYRAPLQWFARLATRAPRPDSTPAEAWPG